MSGWGYREIGDFRRNNGRLARNGLNFYSLLLNLATFEIFLPETTLMAAISFTKPRSGTVLCSLSSCGAVLKVI